MRNGAARSEETSARRTGSRLPARDPQRGAPSTGTRVRMFVVGAIVAVGASGCAVAAPPAAPEPVRSPSPSPSETPAPPPTPASEPLTIGEPPTTVTVPAMDLSEPLIDLGILDDGSMEVPTDFADVGWFTGGGRPGGVGPTVIAGHVDSTSTGPAVFFRLTELVPGDAVQVTDATGAVFDYEVYEVGDYPKAQFPTARVFGAIATDEVRLITCTGLFDTSIGHYEDNRVVFAKRV